MFVQKKMPRFRLFAVALALVLAPLTSSQAYPDKPITLIVNGQAGAPSDFVARMIAERGGPKLGQPILIENQPGAGGILGAQKVAKSAPDGYTLGLFNQGVLTTLPYISKDLSFDPQKDFEPIAIAGTTAAVLVVRPGLGVKTLAELIALAKMTPGKIKFASVGIGSPQHLYMERLNVLAKTKMTHVPYRGAPQAFNAVVSGEVDAYWTAVQISLGAIKDGRVVALAVCTPARSPSLPDLPTVREATTFDYEFTGWWAIFAPRGTPDAITHSLQQTFREALEDPSLVARFQDQGVGTQNIEPDAIRKLIDKETAETRDLITTLGLQPK
jgi:tripartite-type tricarboxylate transporter receptor subunit TctC